MEESYIPKASEGEFCKGINLCSVRKTEDGVSKIGIKDLSGNITEEKLESVINSDIYNNKKIIRVYSSGHIFISNDKEEVFLVTTEKNSTLQHQFTGGSPLENQNKQVIFREKGFYKFDIEKVRENAKNRTGVEVLEEYNKKPIVDWVLMENENITGGAFYKIDDLPNIKNIAPNAYIVSKKAVELLSRLNFKNK